MNLWQDLRLGENFPEIVQAVVELSKGSKVKLALDHEGGFLKVKDFLIGPKPFPFHYGFFPHTVSTDGDPLDIILLTTRILPPLCVVETRPIGTAEVHYPKKGQEQKIIAICKDDPSAQKIRKLEDLDPSVLEDIRSFYKTFTTANKRDLYVQRFGDLEEARRCLLEAATRFDSAQKKSA